MRQNRRYSDLTFIHDPSIIKLVPEKVHWIRRQTDQPTKYFSKQAYFQRSIKRNSLASKKLIINPNHIVKFLWDMIAMIIILIQGITLPLFLAYQFEVYEWQLFEQSVIIFFLIDIILSFNTGFYKRGVLITSRVEISKNYLKGWFWIDIFSSFPYEDFSVLFGGDDTDAFAAIAPMLRFLKIFRLLKLLRMAKLRKIFIDLEEYIASSFVSKAAYFIKLALFVYYIIHWLSCVLVYLGLQIVITDVNWLDNLDIIYQSGNSIYTRAVYWSISTMTTVGYGDFHPSNIYEMIFTNISMLITCAVFPYILSSVTLFLAKQTYAQSLYREKVVAINAYMKSNQINNVLKYRVRRYLDYIVKENTQNQMDEAELLQMLSPQLKLEIYQQTRGHVIKDCYPFQLFTQSLLFNICSLMGFSTFSEQDKVFNQGENTVTIYFILSGTVQIFHKQTRSVFAELSQGCYFGELGFFLQLPRCSSAQCIDFVEMFTLVREDFIDLIQRSVDDQSVLTFIEIRTELKEFSVLGVRCYLCKKLGHVAIDCNAMKIDRKQQTSKDKWLRHQQNMRTKIHPNSNISKRKNRNWLFKVGPQILKNRQHSAERIFRDYPSVLEKLKNFNNKSELKNNFLQSWNIEKFISDNEEAEDVTDLRCDV